MLNESIDNDFLNKNSKLADLVNKRKQAYIPASPDKQHQRGKYTARERIELLFDPGTFSEIGTFIRHTRTR